MSLDTQETQCQSVRVSRASRRLHVGQQVRPEPDPHLPGHPAQAFVRQEQLSRGCPPFLDT